MKTKGNTILKSTLGSIGLAAAIFVIIGVAFDIANHGAFQMEDYSFSKMAAGALAIGLGFGLPSFIYENDSMSLLVQTLIHMGIGCVVMTATAFVVGWIPTDHGILAIIVAIAGEIAIAFVIWLFFYGYNRKLAKKMSKRISEINA